MDKVNFIGLTPKKLMIEVRLHHSKYTIRSYFAEAKNKCRKREIRRLRRREEEKGEKSCSYGESLKKVVQYFLQIIASDENVFSKGQFHQRVHAQYGAIQIIRDTQQSAT